MGLFTKKIQEALENKDISVREFGRMIDVSPGYAHQIATSVIPDGSRIKKICQVLGLDEYKMRLLALIEKQKNDEDREILQTMYDKQWDDFIVDSHGIVRQLPEDLSHHTEFLELIKQRLKGEITHADYERRALEMLDSLPAAHVDPLTGQNVRVPVFDAQGGPAGAWTDGGYPVGEASEYEWLPAHMVDENSFIVVVHGDSMAPGLPEGSRALIVPSQPLEQGKLCFASFPGEDGDRMVKRYYRYGDTIVLKSDNPAHQEITLDASNGHGVHLYRVTWIRE